MGSSPLTWHIATDVPELTCCDVTGGQMLVLRQDLVTFTFDLLDDDGIGVGTPHVHPYHNRKW